MLNSFLVVKDQGVEAGRKVKVVFNAKFPDQGRKVKLLIPVGAHGHYPHGFFR